MPIVSVHQSAMAEVGRVGRLDLHYQRQGPRTILRGPAVPVPGISSRRCIWMLPGVPSPLSSIHRAASWQAINCQSMRRWIATPMSCSPLRPPIVSIARWVRKPGKRLPLDRSGAVLEWFPEMTIPFAGSRFVQTMDVRLARGATVLIWDSVASGRVARDERWAFTSLQNHIQITTSREGGCWNGMR